MVMYSMMRRLARSTLFPYTTLFRSCGSVLNVWKRVDSYAKDGFTAVIHGKCYHEETKATSSQVTKYPSGKRSEEHTSELQSHSDLVCRLLLEKNKASTAPSSCSSIC